jgi:hypothetical protein
MGVLHKAVCRQYGLRIVVAVAHCQHFLRVILPRVLVSLAGSKSNLRIIIADKDGGIPNTSDGTWCGFQVLITTICQHGFCDNDFRLFEQ